MRGKSGFTLVELAVVIVVLGLLLALLIGMSSSLVSQQRMQTTRTRLAAVDTALALYVSINKRLPCPADGRVGASTGGAEYSTGTGSARACTGDQQHGVVPWSALGLAAAEVEDGWGGRFTYRVGPGLVVDSGMDFTSCDPAGTSTTVNAAAPWCITAGTGAGQCNAGALASCTPPAIALRSSVIKGVVVQNRAGTNLMDPRGSAGTCAAEISTGAAYVVVSHGAEGGGAYGSEGILLTSSVTAGTKEAMNFANLAYTAPACGAAVSSYLVDDTYAGGGTNHFDDMVSRPSILAVALRAQVGPRAH